MKKQQQLAVNAEKLDATVADDQRTRNHGRFDKPNVPYNLVDVICLT